MASTISNATLTVKLTETLTLNGSNHGSTQKMTITGINEVSKRILEIPSSASSSAQIYAGASAAAYGTFVTTDVKYIRITNLDDSANVILHLESSTSYTQLAVPAGHVFMLTDLTSSLDNAAAIGSISAEDITRIDAMGDGAAVDIEIMVASS